MGQIGIANLEGPFGAIDSGITGQLLESLPVAVYVCSTDGIIRYFNRRAAELWGRSPMLGDTDLRFCGSHQLFFPDGRSMPHHRTPMAEVLHSGEPQQNREALIERPDHSRIHVLVNIEPLRDDHGVLIGAVNVFQDITEQRMAEQALHDTEQRFARFMQHLPGLAWIKDLEGRYVYANLAATEAFGVSREELYERTDDELFPAEAAKQFRQNDRQALASGAGIQVIETLLQDDGVLHHSLVSKFPISASDGKAALIGGMAIDITEHKRVDEQLQESEHRFRFLAETIPSMIWSAAPDGTITYANQRWYDYCGLTAEENAHNWPELVLHPDDYDRCMEHWKRALRERTPYEVEVRNRRHDGVYRWFVTRAVPLKDDADQVISWFGVTTDVHDQVEMKQQLVEADRRKDHFLAMLAHELRNPLAPIRSGLDLLAMRESGHEDVISLMQRQVDHMVRLVDDLLDVSRIVRGRIELRRAPVELSAIMRQSVDALRTTIEQRGQVLTVALPQDAIYVDVDAVRLVQVIENLLNNASKYTEKGGQIELVVKRNEDQGVLIEVKDNGVGIAPDFLPSVFDLFSQGTCSLDRSDGGLGIGLTLVKSLVEMHGGSVTAYSDGVGKGSQFVVQLPIVQPSIQAEERPASVAPSEGRRILVVDDNVGAAKLLTLLIGRMGPHEIETAYDGPSAVEKALQFKPEIMLLDIGLPKMDGYAVASKLREHGALADMLLVALTGYGQDEDRQRSKDAGFDVHLVKPVKVETIQQLLCHPNCREGCD